MIGKSGPNTVPGQQPGDGCTIAYADGTSARGVYTEDGWKVAE